MILHELRDAPGEVVFRIATDAAAGEVEDLVGNRARARPVDADLFRLVHEYSYVMAPAVPVFEQTHQQRRFAGAQRPAQDIEGNGKSSGGHTVIVTARIETGIASAEVPRRTLGMTMENFSMRMLAG